MGVKPIDRNLLTTSCEFSASREPSTSLPLLSLTLYAKVSGITRLPRCAVRGFAASARCLRAVQQSAEVFFVRATLERGVERNLPLPHEHCQRHVHRDHAVLAARLEH